MLPRLANQDRRTGAVMGAGYTTDPVALAGCRSALLATVADARSALHDVRDDAETLLGARWQGHAAAAFRDGWEQWYRGAGAMVAALEELADALGESAVGYATTEDAVRTSMAAS